MSIMPYSTDTILTDIQYQNVRRLGIWFSWIKKLKTQIHRQFEKGVDFTSLYYQKTKNDRLFIFHIDYIGNCESIMHALNGLHL